LRRENIDLSYKDRTSNIITNTYKEWQLPFNNSRELTHVLTNRLVSITEDLYSEIEYVENMFFPDAMDINEEWLVYEVNNTNTEMDLLLSGDPLASHIVKVTTMDDFIAGPYDHFDIISSGDMNFNIKHACNIDAGLSFLTENKINIYNPNSNIIITSDLYTTLSGETTISVNKGIMDFAFPNEMENITITDINNNVISYKYINQTSCNGEYVELYDTDNNGIMNQYELMQLETYRLKTSSEYSPEEWDTLKWMDIDQDGVIGQSDYTFLTSLIPSMRGDIKSAISISGISSGQFQVSYEVKVPRSALVISNHGQYKVFYNTDEIALLYSKIVYDDSTQILYGINKKDKLVYANLMGDDFNIISTSRIFINTGLEKHTIVDLALHNGYLFVLTSYSSQYFIYFEDTRKEFLEYVDRKANVMLDSGITLTGMIVDKTGYFYFHNDTVLFKVKAHRNKFIEMNDTIYMNIDYPITNLSGDSVTLLPWNIFNSFDSFAFSFGIDRPAGCNNIKMKELIYDFWKYRQGNDPIGINYGIKRELGITNVPNSYETIRYILPAPIDTSGDIRINNINMVKTMGQNIVNLSGTPGSFILSGLTDLIPDNNYYLQYKDIKLEADFIAENNEIQNLTYNIVLSDLYTSPEIQVFSLGDPEYIKSDLCLYKNQELKSKIREKEQSDPFIYKNIITDIYPINGARISGIPINPTIYGPDIEIAGNGIIEI